VLETLKPDTTAKKVGYAVVLGALAGFLIYKLREDPK